MGPWAGLRATLERLAATAVSSPALSRVTGRLSDLRLPRGPAAPADPRLRAGVRGRPRRGARCPSRRYPSFNAFFTRRLREGARPVARGAGRRRLAVRLAAERDRPASRRTAGSSRSRARATRSRPCSARPRTRRPSARGVHATLYLSPAMYHRVHSPVDGRVVAWRYVPGRLFPVNARRRALDARASSRATSAWPSSATPRRTGRVAVVLVGAANVGRMSLAFTDLVTNRGRPGGRTRPRASRSRCGAGTRSAPSTSARPSCCSSPTPALAPAAARGRPRPRGPGPVASRLTVGVVSDTHGLVRPEAIEALRGSDVILHAGDIGGSHVLAGARRARAGASRCAATWTAAGRASCRSGGALDLGGRARAGPPRPRARRASTRRSEGLRVVVFGHSHQPLAERREGRPLVQPRQRRAAALPAAGLGRPPRDRGRPRPSPADRARGLTRAQGGGPSRSTIAFGPGVAGPGAVDSWRAKMQQGLLGRRSPMATTSSPPRCSWMTRLSGCAVSVPGTETKRAAGISSRGLWGGVAVGADSRGAAPGRFASYLDFQLSLPGVRHVTASDLPASTGTGSARRARTSRR